MTDDADVVWSFGPIKVMRLDCPHCDESWNTVLLLGAIIRSLIHFERNHLEEES